MSKPHLMYILKLDVLRLLGLLLGSFRRLFSFRRHLLLENLALPQQLMVFKRHNSRPKMG